MYEKSINKKLNFYECLQLIDTLINNNLLQKDPNNANNILVYRVAGESSPEGWYSENIHTTAQELAEDRIGQKVLRKALENKGISLSFEEFTDSYSNDTHLEL